VTKSFAQTAISSEQSLGHHQRSSGLNCCLDPLPAPACPPPAPTTKQTLTVCALPSANSDVTVPDTRRRQCPRPAATVTDPGWPTPNARIGKPSPVAAGAESGSGHEVVCAGVAVAIVTVCGSGDDVPVYCGKTVRGLTNTPGYCREQNVRFSR